MGRQASRVQLASAVCLSVGSRKTARSPPTLHLHCTRKQTHLYAPTNSSSISSDSLEKATKAAASAPGSAVLPPLPAALPPLPRWARRTRCAKRSAATCRASIAVCRLGGQSVSPRSQHYSRRRLLLLTAAAVSGTGR